MKRILIFLIVMIVFSFPSCSAAHYIAGVVENARDGTEANGHTIILWNPTVGIEDNLSDIIGPEGNSYTDKIYMIDCEMLQSGCNISSTLSLRVINNGDNYVSGDMNVSVGEFGYDVAGNITLNSPPNITSINVEDDLTNPQNEIDLLPAETKEVICTAIAMDYEGEESITNATARFFDNTLSNYEDSIDNNRHYRNDSCVINYSYGNIDEVEVSCKFYIWYYASSSDWNCTINMTDNFSTSSKKGDLSFINPLLALGLDSIITFNLNSGNITEESKINVTNYGNIKINLSLSGYGSEENDGYAMNCSEGDLRNISIENERFNLTTPNPGLITIGEFETKYTNLTSYPNIKKYNLDYRKDDETNDAINSTYWRIDVPSAITGNCEGNIVFGAVQAPGD
jgi:hypothetical protein